MVWDLIDHLGSKDSVDTVGGRLRCHSLSNLRTVVLRAGGEVRGHGGWDVILSVNTGLKS